MWTAKRYSEYIEEQKREKLMCFLKANYVFQKVRD